MIKGYKGVEPKIDETAFIADSADVIGQVNIGKNANIWYGTVLRADDNHITVGENTNIQDGSVVHISEGYPTVIGDNVTIGHKSIIHGCEIGNNTLIGMGSIVLDGAKKEKRKRKPTVCAVGFLYFGKIYEKRKKSVDRGHIT